MEEGFRRPKKGDNPFLVKAVDPDSPTWVCLEWLASLDPDDSHFARAFKEAGDTIIEGLGRGKEPLPGPHDMFFMPIAYLYRHCLELKMKQVIRLGIKLGLMKEDDKISNILKEHPLYQLWNQARKVIEKHWPQGLNDDLNAVERIIQKFHNIDASGQDLRYSEDSSGRKTLPRLPKSVELTHLKDVFEVVFNFLDGCECGLEDALHPPMY